MKNPLQGNALYSSSVHPKENTLYKVSFSISLVLWILFTLITFWMGLLYVGFWIVWFLVTHAIFLSYVKWYGIQITKEQFPNIFIHMENAAKKLQIDIPEAYIYNMDGIFNAFATHFLSRSFVIVSASILNACNGDDKKIEFVITHEMVHVQRNHTRIQWFLLPSRIIPWLGNAYSKVCEYTCDGVAARFVMENKDEALLWVLLLPTADSKRASEANIDAYLKQREGSWSFWMTLVETNSSHPYSFNRIAFIKKIFWDSIIEIKKSPFWLLFAPFFSFGFIIVLYMVIIVALIATGVNETEKQEKKDTGYSSEQSLSKNSQNNIHILSNKDGEITLSNADKQYTVTLPSSYEYNGEWGDSDLSYGNFKGEKYILINAISHKDSELKSFNDMFSTYYEDFQGYKVEKLSDGSIPNPRKYVTQDYRVVWSFEDMELVRYIRLVDVWGYYISINTWTFSEREKQNKDELFKNISSFDWKVN